MSLRTSMKSLLPSPARAALREVRGVANAVRNRGKAHACPICGAAFAEFLPGGQFDARAARCPGCDSLERHRHTWLFLQRHTNFFTAPLTVLHLAPERFLQWRLKQLPNLVYLSGDLMSPDAMVKLDVTNLPFADASFDVIFCSHVLEHVPDDAVAVRELMRVLKPSGWSLLDAPVDWSRESTYEDWSITDPQDRLRAFGQTDHVRVFGQDYPDRLRAGGTTLEMDPLPITPEERHRYGLHPEGHIYFCRRPATD